MSERGLFVVFEGGDGSGKGTQTKLAVQDMEEKGKEVFTLSFPQYGDASAYFASAYLRGEYGGVNDVHPDLASLAYAVDRYSAKSKIESALARGSNAILDRYVASNLAHQGTKLRDEKLRHEFYKRILDLEYNILGLPQPDKNIVLLVDATTSQENVDKKDARAYTDKKRDIHEADREHLELAKRGYEELCELFPDSFIPVECMADGKMRSIEDIRAEIQGIVDL